MPYCHDFGKIEDYAAFLEAYCAPYDEKQRSLPIHLSTLQSVLCRCNTPICDVASHNTGPKRVVWSGSISINVMFL